ncbi:MAG: hypothetical protein ACLUUO_16670 [Sellimonas intestinalis]
MKNNRIRPDFDGMAAGIYLACTGFDLTRAVIGSSEKNKWVFLAFAVLFLVFGATVIVMNVRGMIQDYKDGRREKKSEDREEDSYCE